MQFLSLLQENTGFFLVITLLLGLAVGSFLNVVIYRLPKILFQGWRSECRELLEISDTEDQQPFSLSTPASSCPSCGHKIRALQNLG